MLTLKSRTARFAVTTSVLGVVFMLTANPVVPPPGPPDPVSAVVQTFAKSSTSSAGPVAVGGAIAYVGRGMIGTQVIAHAERRQANGCEFATWPFDKACKPGKQERKYLEFLLTFGNIPSVQEKVGFARANGVTFSWPQTTKATQNAIRIECRSFAFNASADACRGN